MDAGPFTTKNPSHIFVTHNHIDHVGGLPFTLFCNDPKFRFEIHAPEEAEQHIKRYVEAMYELNDLLPPGQFDPTIEKYHFRGHSSTIPSSFRMNVKKIAYEVDVVNCDHTVPTVGYCFSEIRQHLKEEHVGKDRTEIIRMKSEGVEVSEELKVRLFAYICDSSISVLESNPVILQYKIIFIECTFLYPEEEEQARLCKHIHWNQLMPYVISHPSSLFVLFHFTLRHEEEEIINFFENVRRESGINNIKIWVGDTTKDLPSGLSENT